MSGIRGTHQWIPPEFVEHYGKEHPAGDSRPSGQDLSDIFSLGCVFFYIVKEGLHPFGDLSSYLKNIQEGNPVNMNGKLKPSTPWISYKCSINAFVYRIRWNINPEDDRKCTGRPRFFTSRHGRVNFHRNNLTTENKLFIFGILNFIETRIRSPFTADTYSNSCRILTPKICQRINTDGIWMSMLCEVVSTAATCCEESPFSEFTYQGWTYRLRYCL